MTNTSQISTRKKYPSPAQITKDAATQNENFHPHSPIENCQFIHQNFFKLLS